MFDPFTGSYLVNFMVRHNETHDDYEVYLSMDTAEVLASFDTAANAQQWIDILERKIKLENEKTIDDSGYKVVASNSMREWAVTSYYGMVVAVFRDQADAYLWREIMNSKYNLKLRSN